jgi:hypothetical protein
MKAERANGLTSFNGALKEMRGASSETVTKIAEQATESAKRAVAEVDQSAHRSPWYFIGGAAAAAGALGFYAGRKLRF